MSALDHPTLLTKLVIASECALQMRLGMEREALMDLVLAIEAEQRKPVDQVRVINEEILMCATAVAHADQHLRSARREASASFLRVVGVLLPEVRRSLELAIEQRKRPSP